MKRKILLTLAMALSILTLSFSIACNGDTGNNGNNNGGVNPPTTHTCNYVNGVCEWCNKKMSVGLEYKLIGVEYQVVGIGECTDTDIVIPSIYNDKPVTRIGDGAFYECESLTSVEIPNSVTSIGDDAFRNCTSLTSIEIPNSVTSIGGFAFSSCTSLIFNVKDGLKYLGNSQNKYLCLISVELTSITTVTIDSNCKVISDRAFSRCKSLTNIVIPNSVISIGNYMFYGCTSLTSIEIPNSVTSIGDGAFFYCDSLTSIEIPNSVTSIGKSAFSWCDSLTNIVIPNSVTSIGDLAFRYCESLTIYCEAESEPSGWNSDWNYDNRPVYWGQ